MKKRLFIIVFVLMGCVLSPLYAQEAKKESVKELLVLTGTDKTADLMLQQLVATFKQMDSKVPDHFWNDVLKEVDMNEMIDMMVPIYQKYLSEEDIQKTIGFYKTTAGQNFIKYQPVMFQESAQVGQEWGKMVAQRVLMKYQMTYATQK